MSTSSAASPQRVNVSELIDSLPLSSYQTGILILCLLVTLLDGFDSQMIGVAGPQIAQMLRLSPKALGVVFSASYFGAMFGALTFGMLADRWGRKRMLIVSALLFGGCTLLITQINSVGQLAVLRLIGGLGLGGAVPNAVAFGTEFSPSRMRASLASLMWVGVPGGSALVGLAAVYVLPRYHWQALFWIGGVLPLLIMVVLLFALPESISFLVRQGSDQARVRRIMTRISPSATALPQTEFITTEKKLPGVPMKHLFMEGRALTTILLWLLFYLSFLLLIFVTIWNPTLLRRSGASIQQASIAYTLWNLAAVVATLTVGRVMDKFNYFNALSLTFVISALSVGAFGIYANNPFLLVACLSILSGVFVSGANSGIMALAALSYPPAIRGTGIGWAFAFGRFGAMSGPLVGGYLLSLGWSVATVCVAIGASGVLAAILILLLKMHVTSLKRQSGEGAALGASAGR
jgi:AAHS family 4-hydroxybenzoate transporter-like MFS transporter